MIATAPTKKVRDRFTTGQVAKLLQCAPRTVGKLFDAGRLRGYKLPGTQDRRIPRAALIEFMKDSNVPGWEELIAEQAHKIALVGCHEAMADGLRAFLSIDAYRIEAFSNVFRAGHFIIANKVAAVVIDLRIGRAAVAEVIGESPAGMPCVIVAPEETSDPEHREFKECGRLLRYPFGVAELAEVLAEIAK